MELLRVHRVLIVFNEDGLNSLILSSASIESSYRFLIHETVETNGR